MRLPNTILSIILLSSICSASDTSVLKSDAEATLKRTPLEEAVANYKAHLSDIGKPEYAALLSAERVRSAIRTGIESYETLLEKQGEPYPNMKAHFENHSKPLYRAIADDSKWPDGAKFTAFFGLKQSGVTYDGIGLRLYVSTPNSYYEGFAMPIIDLYYGKFARNVENPATVE